MSYSQLSLLIGACLGAGLLLVWMSLWERKPATRTQRRWVRELDDMLTAAGFPRMHPIHLVLLTLALLIVVVLAVIVPFLAVVVRRLHDANMAGPMAFLLLVPFVGTLIVLVLMLLPSKPEGARFDRA